jgi:hypothetical protein
VLLHPGWLYDGKERSVRSDVRLKLVLLLFMMRKVCDGNRNGDKGSRSFGKRADVGAYRGKPRGDSRRKAAASRPMQPFNAEIGDRKSRRPFTFG